MTSSLLELSPETAKLVNFQDPGWAVVVTEGNDESAFWYSPAEFDMAWQFRCDMRAEGFDAFIIKCPDSSLSLLTVSGDLK